MGVFTRRGITVTPARLHTSASLEDLAEAAIQGRYPDAPERASAGWGSPSDDDYVLGQPVSSALRVGTPELLDRHGELPKRLRLRYYWHTVDASAQRTLDSNDDAWNRWHMRDAMDVVLLAERTDSIAALISSRDRRKIRAHTLKGLQQLLGIRTSLQTDDDDSPVDRVEFDSVRETLVPDFFTWLLYKLNSDCVIGEEARLEVIDELSSRDRQLRGARFKDRATLERIELAALITMGDHRFGPAKVSMAIQDLEASINAELELDGGFSVYRTSEYDQRQVTEDELGHALVEDVWSIVLPRMRAAYEADAMWRDSGRRELREGAISHIRSILPD